MTLFIIAKARPAGIGSWKIDNLEKTGQGLIR